MATAESTGPDAKGVLLFADPASRRQLAAAIAANGRFRVIEADSVSLQAIPKPLHAVVIDLKDGSLLDSPLLGQLRDRLAGVPLILVSQVLGPERVRQVVKLGAADWLQQPVGDQELLTALGQIDVDGSKQARVLTVIPASGGAGATTMALLAARFLSQKSRLHRVALVDLDFASANCGAYLNSPNGFDLDSLVTAPERLDAELVDQMKASKSGLSLYSFQRPNLYFEPRAREFVLRLLDQTANANNDVVVDLPNLRTPWFEDVVRHSDHVAIVFELNVPSLGHARKIAELVASVRGGDEGIVGIANRSQFKVFGNVISRADVKKFLGSVPFYTVSDDPVLLRDALNRGLLPAEIAPQAYVVRDARKLLSEMLERKGCGDTITPRRDG